MIRRLVLVKLKDAYANDAARAELAARSRDALPKVPGVRGVTVGLPADETAETAWDLSLCVDFTALDDVAPYIAHPVHRAYVDEDLKPKTEILKVWNFEIAT